MLSFAGMVGSCFRVRCTVLSKIWIFLARCMVILSIWGRGIGFLPSIANLNAERQESFSCVETSLWVCRTVNCPHVSRIQIPEMLWHLLVTMRDIWRASRQYFCRCHHESPVSRRTVGTYLTQVVVACLVVDEMVCSQYWTVKPKSQMSRFWLSFRCGPRDT